MKKSTIYILVILLLLSMLIGLSFYMYHHIWSEKNTLSMVVVNKREMALKIVNKVGDTIKSFPIAVGTNMGNKEKVGDLKTPEGIFPVVDIEDASTWKYDFENDNRGPVEGAYGPWFIRLDASPHKGIGIHGTHDNTTIGKRVSHGCVRMKNEDLLELVSMVKPGILVYISPDVIIDTVKKKK